MSPIQLLLDVYSVDFRQIYAHHCMKLNLHKVIICFDHSFIICRVLTNPVLYTMIAIDYLISLPLMHISIMPGDDLKLFYPVDPLAKTTRATILHLVYIMGPWNGPNA
jgi:hypothetical protein